MLSHSLVASSHCLSARNSQSSCTWTPLQLINAKADVNKTDEDGFTGLMAACENGYDACVLQLIKAKADVNKTGEDGSTALMLAYKQMNGTIHIFLLYQKKFQWSRLGRVSLKWCSVHSQMHACVEYRMRMRRRANRRKAAQLLVAHGRV